jgi:hypothetical protein
MGETAVRLMCTRAKTTLFARDVSAPMPGSAKRPQACFAQLKSTTRRKAGVAKLPV